MKTKRTAHTLYRVARWGISPFLSDFIKEKMHKRRNWRSREFLWVWIFQITWVSLSCSSWTSIYDPAGSWIFVFSKDNRTIRNEIHIKYGWNGIFGFFLLTRHVIAIWLLVLFLFSWYYNCVLSLSNLLRCFILCQYAIAKTFMWREDNTQKG